MSAQATASVRPLCPLPGPSHFAATGGSHPFLKAPGSSHQWPPIPPLLPARRGSILGGFSFEQLH